MSRMGGQRSLAIEFRYAVIPLERSIEGAGYNGQSPRRKVRDMPIALPNVYGMRMVKFADTIDRLVIVSAFNKVHV